MSAMDDFASTAAASQRKRRGRAMAAIAVLALVAAAIVWSQGRTYHLAVVEKGVLYRSGNRSVPELANAVRMEHIKTVVSLIDDQELADPGKPQFLEEQAYLQKNGIRQERIPVKLGGWPTTDDVKRFLAIVADAGNRPVLVHCAQGVRRTGMFVAAYQEAGLGYSREKAKDAIQAFGHGSRTVEDVKKFIDTYDPSLGIMATTLPTGGEE